MSTLMIDEIKNELQQRYPSYNLAAQFEEYVMKEEFYSDSDLLRSDILDDHKQEILEHLACKRKDIDKDELKQILQSIVKANKKTGQEEMLRAQNLTVSADVDQGLLAYIHLLEKIVYGYLRIYGDKYSIFIPEDIKRLCYLWYHPNSIYLTIIEITQRHLSIGIIPTETVLELKGKIEQKTGIPPDKQVLIQIHLKKELNDSRRICDYNLHNNDILQLKQIIRG